MDKVKSKLRTVLGIPPGRLEGFLPVFRICYILFSWMQKIEELPPFLSPEEELSRTKLDGLEIQDFEANVKRFCKSVLKAAKNQETDIGRSCELFLKEIKKYFDPETSRKVSDALRLIDRQIKSNNLTKDEILVVINFLREVSGAFEACCPGYIRGKTDLLEEDKRLSRILVFEYYTLFFYRHKFDKAIEHLSNKIHFPGTEFLKRLTYDEIPISRTEFLKYGWMLYRRTMQYTFSKVLEHLPIVCYKFLSLHQSCLESRSKSCESGAVKEIRIKDWDDAFKEIKYRSFEMKGKLPDSLLYEISKIFSQFKTWTSFDLYETNNAVIGDFVYLNGRTITTTGILEILFKNNDKTKSEYRDLRTGLSCISLLFYMIKKYFPKSKLNELATLITSISESELSEKIKKEYDNIKGTLGQKDRSKIEKVLEIKRDPPLPNVSYYRPIIYMEEITDDTWLKVIARQIFEVFQDQEMALETIEKSPKKLSKDFISKAKIEEGELSVLSQEPDPLVGIKI